MGNINTKTIDQIKTKIEEATNFFASGDPIDWHDVKYICNVVLELIKRIEQLEHERNTNPHIKCRNCKHWEGGEEENIYADWCSYLERTTACDFYCAKGKEKHE